MFTNCIASISVPLNLMARMFRLLSRQPFLFQSKAAPFDETHTRICAKAEVILDRYGNSIVRLAYSYLHNLDDAEEILQETLIQFLKHNPVFENDAHERTWLLRVAGNLSKNRIAYNKVRATDELQESLVADQREDLSFVWEAVKNLPVKYREVIHLYYYEGFSTGEIAQILRRNESTVRSHLKRGREQLKQRLKEEYDFDGGL